MVVQESDISPNRPLRSKSATKHASTFENPFKHIGELVYVIPRIFLLQADATTAHKKKSCDSKL